MTPLKQPHGHPGLLALAVIVVAGVIVWLDARRPAPRPAEATAAVAPKAPATQPVVPEPVVLPAATVPAPAARERIVIANGYVMFDGKKTHRVFAPADGLLVKTRSSWAGRTVRPGEILAYLYSSDVYATTEKLLDAIAQVKPQPEIDELRRRLMSWGMTMQAISKIERTKTPTNTMPIPARVGGKVVHEPLLMLPLVRGDETDLFTITEPGRYTVYVELPDADAARTVVTMPAQLRFEGIKKPVTAKVAYVWRRSEGGMRTVRFDVYLPRLTLAEHTPVTARFDFGR